MCAPDRMLTPMTSTSSWIAASTTSSGVRCKPGVDDVHAGVAQRARDDLDAAVVAVEADLGDDDADRLPGLLHGSSLSSQVTPWTAPGR